MKAKTSDDGPALLKKPAGRTLAEFQPLKPAEEKLLAACQRGEIVTIGSTRPDTKTTENCVRAGFLRFLALGGDENAPVHEHGVQLNGAWIEGLLDLECTRVPANLHINECRFEALLVLRDAHIAGLLNLAGSHVPGIGGDRLICNNGVFLRNGFHADGKVRLPGAQIGGNLDCSGATFDGKEGDALSADGAEIKGSVFLKEGFKAGGDVRLLGAQIGGNLDCSGATFDGKEGDALSADGAEIKGSVFLKEGCKASGKVRLLGTQIGGNLDCGGATFDGKEGDALSADGAVIKGDLFLNKGFKAGGDVRLLGAQIGGSLACGGATLDGKEGDALSADRAVIKGSVFLKEGFKASGKVRLLGAQIGRNLDCGGATFDGKEGEALSADGAEIKGSVFLREGFKAGGKVRLPGAQVGGNLDCGGATFDGKEGDALSADGAVIKGDVFLNEGFKAGGKVRLVGVQIGGVLACGGATFDGKEGQALSADRAVIKGSVFLNEGFKASGEVRLLGAQIGGNLTCRGATFDGKEGDALSADGMTVSGAFMFRDLEQPANGVSLSSCHVARLVDDEKSWGKRLVLDGFSYDHIAGGASTNATKRLAWLEKQNSRHYGTGANDTDFRPQPWQQLMRVLRAMGHEEDARQIAIAREKHLRKIGRIGQTPANWGKLRTIPYRLGARAFHLAFGGLIAYGYRPLRLVAILLSMWLLCGAGYWWAAVEGVFAPSNPLVFNHPAYAACSPGYEPKPSEGNTGNWYLCPPLAGEYTGFSPLTYSLDVVLPLVDLQQERDWAPFIPTPKAVWYEELVQFDRYHLTRLLVWLEILFGWIASLLLVAVLTGLTNRDRGQ